MKVNCQLCEWDIQWSNTKCGEWITTTLSKKDTAPYKGVGRRLPLIKPIWQLKVNWISNLLQQLAECKVNVTAIRTLINRGNPIRKSPYIGGRGNQNSIIAETQITHFHDFLSTKKRSTRVKLNTCINSYINDQKLSWIYGHPTLIWK